MIRPSDDPQPKRIPHRWDRPTGAADDHYSWLADRDDPDTIAYLEAENAVANAWFASEADLVETIFGEIRSRIQESDVSAPVAKGDWFYTAQTVEGASYPVHRRGPTADTAAEHLILDQNAEAAGHEFFDVGAFEISPDHRFVAWSADTSGDEHYTLRFRDIEQQVDLADELDDTTWAGAAWSADGQYLFYVVADDQERPYRVLRHRLGTDQASDVEVYSDHDEHFFIGLGATRSGRMIIIQSASKHSSECWLIATDEPLDAPVCVRPRVDQVEYQVDDWGDRLVIVTNLDADDFRVMTAPIDAPDAWTEFVAHRAGRRIAAIEPFEAFLALHEWDAAQPQVRIVRRDGSSDVLSIDAEPHDVNFGPNEQWQTSQIRLSHQSLTLPLRTIDVAVSSGAISVVKATPTPNFDVADYVAARHWATAPDGTKVPIDIVHHVDTPLDGTAPGCVYGYGSYEISMPPWFSVARLSLLDRGAVWALVHPRGGGELGRRWYNDGKLLNKRNTFTDTIACTEYLSGNGIVARDRIGIRGGSAGGLLVGACINLDPARYKAAIAEVPFVDVVTTMSDPTMPLVVTEWDEWGDPRAEPYASYMLSYSPYDNVVAADYPAMFISAGLNDPRVGYHEPAKWAARLRELRTNDVPLLLRTEMGAGHGGPSGRYEAWRDEARVLTFLLRTL